MPKILYNSRKRMSNARCGSSNKSSQRCFPNVQCDDAQREMFDGWSCNVPGLRRAGASMVRRVAAAAATAHVRARKLQRAIKETNTITASENTA